MRVVKITLPPQTILQNDIRDYLIKIQQALNDAGVEVVNISISTTETATGAYGVNEQDMLNNLKTDVNALAVGLNSLLASLRNNKTIDS